MCWRPIRSSKIRWNHSNFVEPFKGSVEFRNVSFRYPGAEEDVLHNISFTAQPGQTTALIGTTGSGKSTIVNLIPRFYEVTQGAIFVDGTDIREVRQHELRDGLVTFPRKAPYSPVRSKATCYMGMKTPAMKS